jgi:hypothetical protein
MKMIETSKNNHSVPPGKDYGTLLLSKPIWSALAELLLGLGYLRG